MGAADGKVPNNKAAKLRKPQRPIMPTAASYLERDKVAPQPTLLERSVIDYGTHVIDKERYISPDWHRREAEMLWPKVWQLACLEQDIPQPGDFLEYTIVDQSILMVRATDGSVKAFPNACRHRGNRLKVGCGNARDIRCSFHAWAWNLDGSLKEIPCRWEFPALTDEAAALRQYKVATWNGLIFINIDDNAAPFESFLGPDLPRHFSEWPPLSTRWKAAHLVKELNCNWKIAMEAFVEAYHAFKVHPQWLNYAADANAQYDAYGLHARVLVAVGVPSPHRTAPISEQEIADSMVRNEFDFGVAKNGQVVTPPRVPPGTTAREALASFRRDQLGAQTGVDFSKATDSQMLDLIEYWVFPNICVWAGEGAPLIYRARPNGDDPNRCLWETMILLPLPEGAERPPAAKPNFIPADKTYAESAPEIPASAAAVFDQDAGNLTKIQLGLKSRGFEGPIFAQYMEMNIRQFHSNLDKWVNKGGSGKEPS